MPACIAQIAHQGVPVIGGGAGENIDAVHVDRVADILEHLGAIPLLLGHLIGSFSAHFFVDVDDRSDDRSGVLIETANVFAATAVDARDANAELLVGTLGRCPAVWTSR